MDKMNALVLFGGVSTEHEVSIISGVQVLNALDKNKYNIIPVYIGKDGEWFKGSNNFFDVKTFTNSEKLKKNPKVHLIFEDGFCYLASERKIVGSLSRQKVDVVLPIFHGRYGEDGAIQGLLEINNTPYIGCGVTASAIGMDKALTKRIAQSIGIPVLKGNWITKDNVNDAMNDLKFPVFIKPVHLGSSIAINKAENKKELNEALEVGFYYDDKLLIEEGLENAKETNISLIGNNPYEISPSEMPVATSAILSFKDKYLSGSGKSKGMASLTRQIPSPIKKETEKRIKEYAVKFFSEIGGEGIVRMDFLISKDEKKVYLNEINTMPGSLAFYLWKEKGINFTKLLDKLIKFAFERKEKQSKVNSVFDSSILNNFASNHSPKISN